MTTILLESETFAIRPTDITGEFLWDAFGNVETEISACYIVKLCRERGTWAPFTHAEIEAVYQAAGHNDGFIFNRLINPQMVRRTLYDEPREVGGGWIVESGDKYFITEEFIRRVHHSTELQAGL